MAEILIQIIDRFDPDKPELDHKFTKRGDVIVAKENGFGWGRLELSGVQYRVVRLPLTLDEALVLTSREVGDGDPRRLLRPNGFYLDVDSPVFRNWVLLDDTQGQVIDLSDKPKAAMNALIKKKPELRSL